MDRDRLAHPRARVLRDTREWETLLTPGAQRTAEQVGPAMPTGPMGTQEPGAWLYSREVSPSLVSGTGVGVARPQSRFL